MVRGTLINTMNPCVESRDHSYIARLTAAQREIEVKARLATAARGGFVR